MCRASTDVGTAEGLETTSTDIIERDIKASKNLKRIFNSNVEVN
jgi:hypothetical protein